MELDNIKGIGPKNIGLLKKLGITTITDLVDYYPYKYNSITLTPLKNGEVALNGIVESSPILTYIRKNLNKLNFRLQIDNYLINVVLFNRGFMKSSLKRGMMITVIGEYDEKKNTILADDIRLKVITSSLIEPVYHLTNGITSRTLHNLILKSLDTNISVTDYIPKYLKDKYDFKDKNFALREIHNPINIDSIKGSILRFKYEELFKFMFKINYLKSMRKDEEGLKRDTDPLKIEEFINGLSFKLTKDQRGAVNDIINDLKAPKRMNRLLLGDVGSGKTIVAVISIYYNYLSGYQSALLVPTEILSVQHFFKIEELLKNYGIRVELLKGGMSKKERKVLLEDLKNGNIDVLIGTHALLESDVLFRNLGLVITDEQHRFGVNARSTLQNKGIKSDILYMSATPIPRTYALTIYGDMDISLIKTKPEGRKEVITTLVTMKDIKSVLAEMLEEIKKGHQIYIVTPSIESSEDTSIQDVTSLKCKIDTAFNHKIPTSILHGKLTSTDKNEIMTSFKENKTKILISTTVIEVGVDVPNATMMVIFNAERFGLATIHQLRGRIGRNSLASKCILISNKKSERLKVLTESSDGFYISEKDFELRGEGDLFGTRQSGDMIFKIANLKTDIKILTQVNIDTTEFIKQEKDNNFKDYPLYQELIKSISHID